MSRINALNLEQSELLDELFFLDESDPEDAEQIERLTNRLGQIKGSAASTVEFLSVILLESRALLEAREDVKRRAEKRRKTAENATERLKSVILRIMTDFDIKKISGEACDVRTQLSPGKLVYSPGFDITYLPGDCVETIPEVKNPITAKVITLIKEGFEIEGVEIIKELGLRIS